MARLERLFWKCIEFFSVSLFLLLFLSFSFCVFLCDKFQSDVDTAFVGNKILFNFIFLYSKGSSLICRAGAGSSNSSVAVAVSVGYLTVAVCTVYARAHTHTCVHPHFAYVCVRQSVSWQRVSIPVLDNILLFYFPFFVEMFKLHNTHTLTHTLGQCHVNWNFFNCRFWASNRPSLSLSPPSSSPSLSSHYLLGF